MADEVCPTEPAVAAWAAQIGTHHLPPVAGTSRRRRAPDELRIDLDPQPGTDFADAARWPRTRPGCCSRSSATEGFPKTSGNRGVHIYLRIEPRWTFIDVRHAAIAFGRELERRMPDRVTTKWWKEERGERIFVDFNQNARDRTIASAYSLRPKPGAPVSTPVDWDELDGLDPRDFNLWSRCPSGWPSVGDLHAEIDDVQHSLEPLLEMYAARRGRRARRDAVSARLPEDAGRAAAGATEPKSGC